MKLKFAGWVVGYAFFSTLIISCTTGQKGEIGIGKTLISENGMVVSAQPEASRVGAEILRKGGNAIDAAVATEFALAVCHPTAGNIGGGGLMVIRMADGEVDAIDYRERAPGGSSRDMYLDQNGDVIEGLSTKTRLGSGVPGTVAGMVEAHARYGRLTFKEVIQPSIDLAAKGFKISADQASSFNRMKELFLERNSGNISFVNDSVWHEGDLLIQPELAATLTLIRDNGSEGFYRGITAELLVEEMKRGNGIITLSDLESYAPVWRVPLKSDYRGYGIISMAPPSSGGVALIQLLEMVEKYPISEYGFQSPEAIHLMIEAERRVYADRAEYLGDPDFITVPIEKLTNAKYLDNRMLDFNPHSATSSTDISSGALLPLESEETTHYSVVDRNGNAVAATTTLNSGYGNGVVVSGAGFLMNNEMDDFSVKPGYPNSYGLVGGEANSIAPGKRMLSSMTPTIVEKGGELYMVVGSPGGSTIITSVFQTIVNVVDFNMNLKEAVDAPRFHHQWLPDNIAIEEGHFDTITIKYLEDMGHIFVSRGSIGRVDAIRVIENGRLEGGADRRGDDSAAGY
jgi:gamma-glutamyltranspeptidase/glutathione hydrolase